MSEDHRSEIDARIHEIKNHNRANDYEEICDLVTRFVQLHHELLQKAGNTLVRAGMPNDAIKHVLSFL
jgi:predicted subunit of tRNA(5-methylaminomethyl-2-thiouridylate) methyltransferase